MTRFAFFASIAFSLAAWGTVAALYIWPALRRRSWSDALRPLLVLHTFRFIGMAFLVPGVVSPDLPASFATPAALGDLVAAGLALLSLLTLRTSAGVLLAWIFNVWGAIDLVNAFYQAGASGLVPGQLGAAFFIPTALVPLALITHALAFAILLRRQPVPVMRESRQLA